MAETVLDGATAGSGGGTATGSLSKRDENDDVPLIIRGDSNTTNLDVAVSGVAYDHNDTLVDANFTASVTGVDATTDSNNDKAVLLSGVRGYSRVEITVTNQASNDTTVSLEHDDY